MRTMDPDSNYTNLDNYANNDAIKVPPSIPVALDRLSDHVTRCHVNGDVIFKKQYQVRHTIRYRVW